MAVALATNALTTLETAKSELGITGTSEDDTLSRYINAASDFCEKYCKVSFYYDAAVVEKVAGYGSTFLAVSRVPLLSVASIEYRGDEVSSDNYEVHGDGENGFIYASGGWNWTTATSTLLNTSIIPGYERKSYTVTYEGGYITPKQEDEAVGTRTLPWDLEGACLGLVSNQYAAQGKDTSVQSEKLMSWSVSYGGGLGTGGGGGRGRSVVSQYVLDILNQYRKPVLA